MSNFKQLEQDMGPTYQQRKQAAVWQMWSSLGWFAVSVTAMVLSTGNGWIVALGAVMGLIGLWHFTAGFSRYFTCKMELEFRPSSN